jgi:hypothetical protein
MGHRNISSLAMNTTRRLMKTATVPGSALFKWLETMMSPPRRGMFSAPITSTFA